MSHLSKITSKLSTLDAARSIYFIVVGLAIKQSLVLFSHDWPPHNVATLFTWWSWFDRSLVGIGYLFTALRYSHGISLLYAFEKGRIETSTLPSATRVFWLSVFLTSLAIFIFLMADNLPSSYRTFLIFTALMLVVDLLYILLSGVIKKPFNIFVRWGETVPGSSPRAALQWIASDIILLGACILFLFLPAYHERLFAGLLIVAAIADYEMNREFYFGGKRDRRKQKIVFVCSPLKGMDDGSAIEKRLRNNIRRVQWYCNSLMRDNTLFQRKVIPFASHCFFTYFLNDHNQSDRIIGRECALAFLSACDAIYVYVPFGGKSFAGIKRLVPDQSQLSEGMRHELDIAKKLGLEIKYFPQVETSSLPNNWQPQWNYLEYSEEGIDAAASKVSLDNTKTRKRVYVCTQLRGLGFSDLENETKKRERLRESVRIALWRCHQLVKEDGELVAPFAPQAFYPYFWEMLDDAGNEGDEWKAWFERSLEILKICDAVYIYTQDGLPNDAELSMGMHRIKELAERLGIEIQYREAGEVPESWKPTTPSFEKYGSGKEMETLDDRA